MHGLSRELWAGFRRHWLVFVGLAAVAALVVAVDPGQVGRALAGASGGALLLMLPCVLILYLLHGLAWWIELRAVGIRLSLRRAVEITYISQAFVFLPGGDLWRVPIVKAQRGGEHVEAGAIAGTVVFDDLVFFWVLSFAMLPAAVRAPLLLLPLATVMAPQLAIFVVLLWPSLYERLVGLVGRIALIRRVAPQLHLLGPTFRRLVTFRTVALVVVTDLACAGLAVALFGLGLGAVHAGSVGLREIAFTYAVGQVVSGLTVLPAALGAYEGMMTGLMAVQGVAPAVAAAGTLLYRAFNDVLMGLLGLVLALAFERERVRELAGRPERPVVP